MSWATDLDSAARVALQACGIVKVSRRLWPVRTAATSHKGFSLATWSPAVRGHAVRGLAVVPCTPRAQQAHGEAQHAHILTQSGACIAVHCMGCAGALKWEPVGRSVYRRACAAAHLHMLTHTHTPISLATWKPIKQGGPP